MLWATKFQDWFIEITYVDIVVVSIALLLVLLLAFRVNFRKPITKMNSSDIMVGYKMIYADQKGDENDVDFGKLLYSAEYELQGKPDCIFHRRWGNKYVPMELKSGEIGEASLPHRGDLLQLAAYFLIIEDVYQSRPKYGKLVYKDYMFVIRNTRMLRKEVQCVAREMRQMLKHGVAKPNNSFANCRHCICNGTVCPHSETEIIGGEENESSCGEEQNLRDDD